MGFEHTLHLVVDLNEDKTKIYNGLSPTKIDKDIYSYGKSIFARHPEKPLSLCYLENILHNKIDYKYVDSDNLDEKEFNSKWIYVLEPIGDPNSWLGTRESQIQKLFNEHFDDSSCYDSIDSMLCGVSDNVLDGVESALLFLHSCYLFVHTC